MNQTKGITPLWDSEGIFDFSKYPNRDLKSEKWRYLLIGDCNCRK
jgi:hypothetical protein